MRSIRTLTFATLLPTLILLLASVGLAADPGLTYPPTSEASDQKAGSVLIYNYYTSGATSGTTQNTRINMTNTSNTSAAFVHLFFVAEGCSVADAFICLTANQTVSFLASDIDPGVNGYIVAVASDGVFGCPTNFNFLIGSESVKLATGHSANLGAVAVAAIAARPTVCNANSFTADLLFNGVNYNRLPRAVAVDHIPARADGNDTLLILNRIGGNLATGAAALGSLFGILYDDAENAVSFSVTGGCQLRGSLSNNFPRTTPRFETFIRSGRSGWLRISSITADIAISGAVLNLNPNVASAAGAFTGGHNLHTLTLSAATTLTLPVFPPSC
jgi:hypothetical protein